MIFVVFYLLSGNWTVSDLIAPPIVKNLFLGFLFLFVVIYTVQESYRKQSFLLILFGLSVLIPSLLNGTSNLSIYSQSLLIICLGYFGTITDEELDKILIILNKIFLIFMVFHTIQWLIIFYNQSLLIYAYPITSTDLPLYEVAKTKHWIQLMGNLTNEQFTILGRRMPRFAGYLTEPSAAANLILFPRVLLVLRRKFITMNDFLFLFFFLFIFKSGFITIYTSLIFILFIFNHFKLLNRVTSIIGILFFAIIISGLGFYSYNFLEILADYSIYGLENKSNTVEVRVISFYNIINNISLFGNSQLETAGVGAAFLYLARYGVLFIIPIVLLLKKLYRNEEFIVLFMMIFALLLLGKGMSSFSLIILIFTYAQASFGYKHTQQNP